MVVIDRSLEQRYRQLPDRQAVDMSAEPATDASGGSGIDPALRAEIVLLQRALAIGGEALAALRRRLAD